MAGVVLALVAVQLYYSRDARAALVPVATAAAFVLAGPWSWRALVAEGRRPLAGAALYAAGGVLAVALGGAALPRLLGLGPTFLTDPGSLLVATVLYLVGGWGLGRDIGLELDLAHSRLQAMRTHLDPHFLYNTLNAIAEWCAEDPRVAEDATLRLAAMMRGLLEGLERRAWPLEREIELTEDLLELHRMRDPEAFTTSFEVDRAAADAPVPPLLLLSLAENAVKHGPRAGHRGQVTVRVSAAPRLLRIEIENPGPLSPAAGGGRGLALLRRRLALWDAGRARLELAGVGGERTRALIELPWRRS
jgi:hypothetical protein